MNRTLACKSREEKVQYTVLFSPLLSKRSPWRPRVCGSPVVFWKKGVKPKEAESRKRAPRGRGRKLLRIRRTGERREGGTWVSCAETHDAEGMCACVAWLLVSTCAAGFGRKEATWRVCGSGDGGGVVWRSTDEGEGATHSKTPGWGEQACVGATGGETHGLHDDPRAARRGSAEEQTGGGPKARTEGEREEEEGGRVREGKEARG